jgi:hypothetical protein
LIKIAYLGLSTKRGSVPSVDLNCRKSKKVCKPERPSAKNKLKHLRGYCAREKPLPVFFVYSDIIK